MTKVLGLAGAFGNPNGVAPDPDASVNVKYVEDNWTFVWNKTAVMPLFYSSWNRFMYGVTPATAESVWRPRIEACHARPVSI